MTGSSPAIPPGSISAVLAPNPGPYTGPGTNSYIVASAGEALVVDPGPVISQHHAALIASLRDLDPIGVAATHTHPDHAPLANRLARDLDVPVYGYAPGPEFEPDRRLSDGDVVRVGSIDVAAVHTPGHTADHLCFQVGDRLLTGDHIIGGSTVVIDDAASYMDSLYKVRDLGVSRIEPGHGLAMDDAGAVIDGYIEHRLRREQEILDALAQGASSVGDVVDALYGGLSPQLRPAAVHQVIVQLKKVSGVGLVRFEEGGADERTIVELVR